jgi:hypothetical protein
VKRLLSEADMMQTNMLFLAMLVDAMMRMRMMPVLVMALMVHRGRPQAFAFLICLQNPLFLCLVFDCSFI